MRLKQLLIVLSFVGGVLFGAFAVWGWTSMNAPEDLGAAFMCVSAGLLLAYLPVE
jgi:hypothetical protein